MSSKALHEATVRTGELGFSVPGLPGRDCVEPRNQTLPRGEAGTRLSMASPRNPRFRLHRSSEYAR